jgi:hypothetical protein
VPARVLTSIGFPTYVLGVAQCLADHTASRRLRAAAGALPILGHPRRIHMVASRYSRAIPSCRLFQAKTRFDRGTPLS